MPGLEAKRDDRYELMARSKRLVGVCGVCGKARSLRRVRDSRRLVSTR